MALSGRMGVLMRVGVDVEAEMENFQAGEGGRGGIGEVAIGSGSCCGGERLTLLSLWWRETLYDR